MKKAVMSLVLVGFMVLCAVWIAQATPYIKVMQETEHGIAQATPNDTRVIFSYPIFLNNAAETKTAHIKVTPETDHGRRLKAALIDTLAEKGVDITDQATATWTIYIFAPEIVTKNFAGKWFNTVKEQNLEITLMITENGKEQKTTINVTGRDTLDMASVAEAIAGLF